MSYQGARYRHHMCETRPYHRYTCTHVIRPLRCVQVQCVALHAVTCACPRAELCCTLELVCIAFTRMILKLPDCLGIFSSNQHNLCIMASKSRKQTFRQEYTTRWPCNVRSKKDVFTARCELCNSDFHISHGGANDIQAHLNRKKHVSLASSAASCQDLGQFFKKIDYSTIRAETLMANFLVEHNIAFAAADHLSDLFKTMFPDSSIAKNFASKRTKTTAILWLY